MTTKLRQPPQDIRAEHQVVGSILLDPNCFPALREWVSDAHFTDDRSRRLYQIEREIADDEGYMAIDPVLVNSRLKVAERDEIFEYICKLMDSIVSTANAVYYARRIHEKYIERELSSLIQHGAMALEDESMSTTEKIETLGVMAELSRNFTTEQEQQTVADLIDKLAQDLTSEGMRPFSTGLNAIDRLIDGLGAGQLILVAGATSMGKTSLLLDMFIHAARIGQRPYYYYLEMLAFHLAQRLVMNIARVGKELATQASDAVKETQLLVKNWPAWIEQRPKPGINDVLMAVRSKHQQDGINVVFIDHIQKIHAPGKDPVQQISYVSNALSLLACELKIPIVCACHVNRETLHRDNHIPKLSDLRGSGSLENDSDVVMILHREDYYREQAEKEPDLDGVANCYVLKNRHGKKGIAELVWLPEYCSFSDPAFPNSMM